MAKAYILDQPKPVEIPYIRLELTKEEAEFLRETLGNALGKPLSYNIYNALCDAGVESPHTGLRWSIKY
jgi:hypothetical protein